MRGICLSEFLFPGLAEEKKWGDFGLMSVNDRQEGFHAFYKGITPRIMRVAPGQAVTFTVYEYLKEKLENSTVPIVGGKYEE